MSFDGFSRERSTPPTGDQSERSVPNQPGKAPGVPDPDGPPAEVLQELGLAAEVYEHLAAKGRELRFRLDPPTGKVTVGVYDLSGKLLYTIPPSKALEIARGEGLDEL